jgi:hypothetical protein
VRTDLRTIAILAAALSITGILLCFTYFPIDLGLHSITPSIIPIQLTPLSSFDELPTVVSTFLWGNRSIDLIGQAFVILASVICCLTLLKTEVEE